MRPVWLWLWIGLLLTGCTAAPETPGDGKSVERVARTQVERGPVTVTVEVSPQPCRLSDEPQLVVTIEHEAGIDVRFPPFGTAFGDFIIRDFREPLPQTRNQRHIRRQVYTLEPVQSGPSQIDPIVVTFIDRRGGLTRASIESKRKRSPFKSFRRWTRNHPAWIS